LLDRLLRLDKAILGVKACLLPLLGIVVLFKVLVLSVDGSSMVVHCTSEDLHQVFEQHDQLSRVHIGLTEESEDVFWSPRVEHLPSCVQAELLVFLVEISRVLRLLRREDSVSLVDQAHA